MLPFKVILQLVCVVIVAILVFLFVVPYIMTAIGSIHPLLFDILEEVRCHIFQLHGMCLSLYPNPAYVDEVVDVTIRTRRWYDGEQACLWERALKKTVGDCCTITDGKCKTSFKASIDLAGTYFPFLDVNFNKLWEEQETAGETKTLVVSLKAAY